MRKRRTKVDWVGRGRFGSTSCLSQFPGRQGGALFPAETGYTTTPSYVDELSAAKYNLNTVFENALNGIARTYLYELVDEHASATDTNVEDQYGEFHNGWTPKTGATAIHNLTTVLQSTGSGTASTRLGYSVSVN